MSWLAHYHYIFVHFPIALIIMASIAELIRAVRTQAVHESVPGFLLIFALLFALPTIGTGLLLEETGIVSSADHDILEWHESLAFTTLALTIATLCVRRWVGRGVLYFISLALLTLIVAITAHFGGVMAFGSLSYLPGF